MSRSSAEADTGYRPTVTAAYAEQIRRWHEETYQSAKAQAGSGQTFDYLGVTLEVPSEVMPITPLSDLLGAAVLAEVQHDDRVLDMGTGSGVYAILAAFKATDVLAVDINPQAVEAAVSIHGVDSRVDRQAVVSGGIQGLLVRAAWMASMGRSPWL